MKFTAAGPLTQPSPQTPLFAGTDLALPTAAVRATAIITATLSSRGLIAGGTRAQPTHQYRILIIRE
jgi:hypothetical protein